MLTKDADFKRVVTGKIFPVYTRIFSVSRGSPRATNNQNVSGKSDSTLKKDFHKLSFSFLKQVCLANLSLEYIGQYEFQGF